MPKRTQLHGCELHPAEDGCRVCHGDRLLGRAHRPGSGNRSAWGISDARGLKLAKSFPSLAGCVRHLRAQAGLPALSFPAGQGAARLRPAPRLSRRSRARRAPGAAPSSAPPAGPGRLRGLRRDAHHARDGARRVASETADINHGEICCA
jgi:hypothetical protein